MEIMEPVESAESAKPAGRFSRNRMFVIIFSALFVFIFVVCPIAYMMNRLGVLAHEDLANYKDPERLYFFDFETRRVRYLEFWEGVTYLTGADVADEAADEGFVMPEIRQEGVPFLSSVYISVMNGIQRMRANVNNIYTNFLPFYAQMLGFESFNNRIDGDFVLALHNWENRGRGAPAADPPAAVQYEEPDGAVLTLEQILEDNPGISLEHALALLAGEEFVEEAPLRGRRPPPAPIWNETLGWESLNRGRIPENASQLTLIANRVADAGMFRVTRVRTPDDSFGFLEISKAMEYRTARRNMYIELDNANRIAAASVDLGVNFFIYKGNTFQSMPGFSDVIPLEFSTYQLMLDFVDGLTDDVAGVSWLDISTPELRLERMFLTDHHWNAYGVVQAYRDVIEMMREVIPEIGEPFPLNRIHYFPGVQFRGSGAARTNTPIYYDLFAVPIFDLPAPHPIYRVHNRFDAYERGEYDFRSAFFYMAHYERFYTTPHIVRNPNAASDRRLLIFGDSMLYWVLEPIAAHFEVTHVHYTLHGQSMNFANFIEQHGITDVLLLQYTPRTIAMATAATVYLEQVVTR